MIRSILPFLLLAIINQTRPTASQSLSEWANRWDGPLLFECPENEYITRMYSVHDNHREDRRWKYGCRSLGTSKSCRWTGYINEMDEDMTYNGLGFISGFESYHSNKYEDRRWKV